MLIPQKLPKVKRRHQQLIYGPSALQILGEAVGSIRHLGRRAVLALVGIAAGSAAVVALINIGNMAQLESASVFKGMGSNLLIANVQPAPGKPISGLLPGDLEQAYLKRQLEGAERVAGTVMTSHEVSIGSNLSSTVLIGSTGELDKIMGLSLAQGRFLSRNDAESTYAVTGSDFAQGANVGTRFRVGNYVYEIVGVLKPHGNNPLFPFNPDKAIFLPAEGMKRFMTDPYLSTIMIKYRQDASQTMAQQLDDALLNIRHDLNVDVQIPETLISGMGQQSSLFNWLILCIGGISLIVGGVGIMNVMLMNVAERKKEIGIRLALGARPRDISGQFLLEAVMLTAVGACTGCLIGLGGATVFFELSGWGQLDLSLSSLLLGAGSSLITGLFFGFYPAMSAAKIEPVRALNDV